MNDTQRPIGIKQQLQAASSKEEVSELLTIGSAFTHASPKTIRSWERVAKARLSFLGCTK